MKTLEELNQAIEDAHEALAVAVAAEYPIGTKVNFSDFRGPHTGLVTGYNKATILIGKVPRTFSKISKAV